MTLPSPVDLLLVLLWVFVVVLTSQRGILGFLVGLVGTVLLKPLQLLAVYSPPMALVAAIGLGLLIGSVGRIVPRISYRQPRWGYPLGALGGVILASALVLTLIVSLPLGRDLNGALRYPSPDLPYSAVFRNSRLVGLGRAILLYPLQREGGFSPAGRATLEVLHTMFVVGRPWEEVADTASR